MIDVATDTWAVEDQDAVRDELIWWPVDGLIMLGHDDAVDMAEAVLNALAPRVNALLAERERAAEARGRAKGRRSRHCGCAWCCASTPPEQRGATHKETCQS